MQSIVDSLRKKGKLYKKMREIAPGELGVRNRIRIFIATDTNGYYWAIFALSQKSKIFVKDVRRFEEIFTKLVLFSGHNFKHKSIFIDAPLCSKAKDMFMHNGWKIQ